MKKYKKKTNNELKTEWFKKELLSCIEKNGLTKNTHPYVIKGIDPSYKTKDDKIEPNIYYHHFIDLYFCKNISLIEEVKSYNPKNWNFFNVGHFIGITIEHILVNSEYDYTYFDIIELLWWFEDYLKENYTFSSNKILIDDKIISNYFKMNLSHGTYLIKANNKDYSLTKERENEINSLEIDNKDKNFFKKIFSEPRIKSSDLLVELVGENPFLSIKSIKVKDTGEDITERYNSKDIDDVNCLWTLTKNLIWIRQ